MNLEDSSRNPDEDRSKAIMFDSNIFDKLLEKENLGRLPKNIKYFATDIQYDEIERTPDKEKRNALLDVFHMVNKIESMHEQWLIFGRTNFLNMRFCSLAEKGNKEHISNNNANHLADALILLTANSYDVMLISNDSGTPFKRAKELGFSVLSFEEFIEKYD